MSQTHIPAALRRLVRERAHNRCEYCLIPESISFAPHWIDHVVAEKHGGKTEAENLANCCVLCNQRKGSDLSSIDPETGEVVPLFHPRRDRWDDHFVWDGPLIVGRTAIGRATIWALAVNDTDFLAVRAALIREGNWNPA